jgi:pimeloyl-ACP methyl ester carboxylesterase
MTSPSNTPITDQQVFKWCGYNIAFRQYGVGEDLVLLHGFPSSSRDWDGVGEQLAKHQRILQFDFLGYGKSDKPTDVSYSAYCQSTLASEVIRAHCTGPVTIVGHDLGGIILQMLLSGSFGEPHDLVRKAIFMNSSVYADLYQPTLNQRLLTTPIVGCLLARAMTEKTFQKGVRAVSGKHADRLGADTSRMWGDFSSNGGKMLAPKHLVYMKERAKAASELERGMESFGSENLAFLYGDADPVSGLHQLQHIRSRLPAAHVQQLKGLGHFPMLEDAQGVATAIQNAVFIISQPDSK